MSNVLPLIIGGAALFYFMGKKPKAGITKTPDVKTPSVPPVVDCIDLGNNLLAFPRIQLPEENLGESVPMIIVLHGRNGNENQLATAIPKDLDARVFFIRANTKNNLFFIPRLKDKEEIVAPAIEKAGEDLLEGIDKLLGIYPTNKIIIFGFSQGSALALWIATKGKADSVLAFSGSLPSLLYPKQYYPVNVLAYHGTKDSTVPYILGKNTIDSFKEKGFNFEFNTTANSHIFPPAKFVKEYFDLALK